MDAELNELQWPAGQYWVASSAPKNAVAQVHVLDLVPLMNALAVL
jgi:hypothetical protein